MRTPTDGCPSCGKSLDTSSLGDTFLSCPTCNADFTATQDEGFVLHVKAPTQPEEHLRRICLNQTFCNRYRLGRVLGTGGMGMVFQATHLEIEREVAIKFLLRFADKSILQRFLLEGRLLAQIHHANVVGVFDMNELEGSPYLVTEYLSGGSLFTLYRQQKRLSFARAVSLISGCLDGLQACHAAGIVHRDIKPENILLNANGVAKIADLGIARFYDEDSRFTATGVMLGTPLYMSPEQARGEDPSVSADLYAMGTVLYEVLAGRTPFQCTTLPQLMKALVMAEPPPIQKLAKGIPDSAAELIARALSKNPSDRPETAAVFASELRKTALAPPRVSTPRTSMFVAVPRPQRPRWQRLAMLLLPVGLLGALVGWQLVRFKRSPEVKPSQSVTRAEDSGPLAIRHQLDEIIQSRLSDGDRFRSLVSELGIPDPARMKSGVETAQHFLTKYRGLFRQTSIIVNQLVDLCKSPQVPGPGTRRVLAAASTENLILLLRVNTSQQLSRLLPQMIADGDDNLTGLTGAVARLEEVRYEAATVPVASQAFDRILDVLRAVPAGQDPVAPNEPLINLFDIGNEFTTVRHDTAGARQFQKVLQELQLRLGRLDGPGGDILGRVAWECWTLGKSGSGPSTSKFLISVLKDIETLQLALESVTRSVDLAPLRQQLVKLRTWKPKKEPANTTVR